MHSLIRPAASDPVESLSALLGRAWTKIDAEDLCPDCQTPAERQVMAHQIVLAIEQHVARNADLNEPPLPSESGLVTYAMEVREALDFAALQATQTADTDSPTNKVAGPKRVDVAITGAFLTGYPLRIGIEEYSHAQDRLGLQLSNMPDQGWSRRVDLNPEGTYNSGGGFTKEIPLVIARVEGPDALSRMASTLGGRPKYEHDWMDSQIGGWEVRPTSLSVDVYDLGVGVVRGTFAVEVPHTVTLESAVRTIKSLVLLRRQPGQSADSPIASSFRDLTSTTTEQFRTAVDRVLADHVQDPWMRLTDVSSPVSDWGRLLWLHPVNMVTSDDPSVRRQDALQLAAAFSRSIRTPGGCFVPGIGWSAIVTNSDLANRDLPLKLLLLHWAYFALYMEIDRGLLLALDQSRRKSKARLAELEADASRSFDDYLRVSQARARVDSALASLGGDEQAIWDSVAGVQKFETLVAGVDRKLEIMQAVADRRVQEVTAATTRRSTMILGFLTMLTLVTVAVTLLGFFVGGLSDKSQDQALRYGVLAVGLFSAVALWFVTFRPRRQSDVAPAHSQKRR